MPAQTRLPSWQELQLVTELLAWIWTPLGAGDANLVPGTVSDGALPASRPLGATWQTLQSVGPDGMCDDRPPGAAVGGSSTILVIPVKVDCVMPEPWQPLQVLIEASCTIEEFANLAPLPTGSEPMFEVPPTWQVSQPAAVGM